MTLAMLFREEWLKQREHKQYGMRAMHWMERK